jgi:MFS family permease
MCVILYIRPCWLSRHARFKVSLLRYRGKRLSWREVSNEPKYVGDLVSEQITIGQERYNVISLRADDPVAASPIAPLYEPVLLGFFTLAFRLRGFESVTRGTSRFGVERTIDWAIAIAGISLMLVASVGAISDIFWDDPEAERRGALYIASFLAVILGAANAMILAPSQSLLQERAPENARARVWAAFFTVSNGVAFLPIVFASALADLFGVVKVLFVIGVILIAVGAIQVTRPRARIQD